MFIYIPVTHLYAFHNHQHLLECTNVILENFYSTSCVMLNDLCMASLMMIYERSKHAENGMFQLYFDIMN
jgi:hypothetical protein